jgi:glycosyltransferase involved in cell wall biosynthesis
MASILLLEPYNTGSHAAWIRGYQSHSAHRVEILSLPGQWWQWRMHGGAVTLARMFLESRTDTPPPDLIIASDMLDLTTFLALTRPQTAHIPTAVYFHENQLTYPPGPRIKRDLRLGFVNYVSALAADAVLFNSRFHQEAFLDELPRLLKHYPDYNELPTIDLIRAKSQVLPLGIDLRRFDDYRSFTRVNSPSLLAERGPGGEVESAPIILWNHRWEYDKNPVAFFDALYTLADEGIDFKVIVAGENIRQTAEEFDQALTRLGSRIIHYGYAPDFATYARLLWRSTIVVSCAWQDFFGISMCEAIYCGCLPIMPRRLNYPDLVPTDYQELCLYDEEKLIDPLRHALKRHSEPAPPALRDHIMRFDWSILAPEYDRIFIDLLNL